MNVTLNIPADAGTERTGTTARRGKGADAEAGNFRALFDQVAQATAAERRPRSDSPSARANTSEDGEADANPRHADGRHDSDPMARDATQDGMSEKPGDGGAVRHQGRDRDAAADVVNRRDARQSDPADDGEATPADASVAVPMGAAVVVPPAEADGAQDDGAAMRSLLSDGNGEPEKGAAAGSSAMPATEDAQTGSGRVRLWVRRDSAAAFAASDGDRHGQPTGTAAKAPQGDGQATPPRAPAGSIDARVTAYERHPAPAMPAAAPKAVNPAVGGVTKNGVPQADGAVEAEGGSPEALGAARKYQSEESLTSADRDGSSAPAKEPADRRSAGQDRIADSAKPAQHDMPEGRQGRTMGPTVSIMAKHGDQKQPAVAGGSPAGSNPAVGASAPVSSLTAGVAQSIAGALDSARAAAATARSDSATDGASPEPVRTIALNLDLREYGRVDLRISLKGNAVSVHLKADRPETADALARDDGSLREALHRAGYEAGQVQVDKRDAAGPRLGDAATSSQQQAGGAGSGASSGQMAGDQRAATPNERPQAQRGSDAFALHEQDTQDVPRQDRYRDPDRLYV